MKTVNALFITILFCNVSLKGNAASYRLDDSTKVATVEKQKNPKKKFIGIYHLKGLSFLEFDHPGLNFNSPMVPGTYRFDSDSFVFSPVTTSTDGFPQDRFDQFFWYNHIVKDLSVPYNAIKSVTSWRGLVIKTKDGRKYRIISRKAKLIRDDLRLRISR